ncbi:DpnD/PcfM family protein [Streptococcus equinus]|uniref:DpnD/PcfM family protein n=1 Tax=Streptococcus equinus TaxID=1335 RepID=UPI0008EA2512|nr:DpnD/PcfM family protein [Streptococcus equinus]SFG03012.1 DpnD/PcfM-like protein [Streptococcus equinus]
MKTFSIEIEEVFQKVVEVEAANKNEALRIVSERYKNEEIILNENDYKGYELRVMSE